MKQDLVQYLSDAISRVEGGNVSSPSGSWSAGIFGKATNAFEKEVRSYVLRLLNSCNLDYEMDLRCLLKGLPFEKLTLGNLIAAIREGANLRPQAVAHNVPGGWKLTDFVKALEKINKTWVDTKHGQEVAEPVLIAQMKSMLTISKMLRTHLW
ncbi:MAG: hypothetical protein WCF59_02075 [Desulfobaccales bacterium]